VGREFFFEDFKLGQSFDLGPRTVLREELVAFAERFDPEPVHLDRDAARDHGFPDIIASGLFSNSIARRLMCDLKLFGARIVLGSGIDQTRWPFPIFAGDVIRGTMNVLELSTSSVATDRGRIRFQITLANQNGRVVVQMQPLLLVPTRDAGSLQRTTRLTGDPGTDYPQDTRSRSEESIRK
jgi:acyl dehydratase